MLKLPPGAAAIITNGRVVVSSTSITAALLGKEDPIIAADFELMQVGDNSGCCMSDAKLKCDASAALGCLGQKGPRWALL